MANLDQNGPKTLDELVHCAQNATSAAGILACGLGYYQGLGIDLVSYHGDSPGAPAILYKFNGNGNGASNNDVANGNVDNNSGNGI